MKDEYGFEKAALDITPELRRTLGHAAMGTAGGAILGGATADPDHRVRGALQGGAIGGLAAGGISHLSGQELNAAHEHASNFVNQLDARHRRGYESILNSVNNQEMSPTNRMAMSGFTALNHLGMDPAILPKMSSHDTYGFKKVAAHDVYGFEKRAWGDLDEAAYFHGFNGPSYSDDPGTPVNMSLINPSEGSRVGHGIGGGMLGGLGGAGLGGMMGAPFGSTGALVGMGIGGVAGALGGGYHGYHNAPKELIMRHGASPGAPAQAQPQQGAPPAEPPKTAQYDIYGFSTKEALAAPGLLGQMGSAISRMGKATGIATQRAGNAFQAERNMSKLTGGQLPNSGFGRSLLSAGQAGAESLMKSQAGRRVIGTGVGLGAAGTLAAGTAAYNATQPKTPVALAR